MTSTNTLLGLGAFVSAIYAFYTGTLGVIWNLAFTNYNAAIFIAGLALVLIVTVAPFFTRTRIRDVHGRNLAIVLIVTLLVIPYVVQGQYDPTQLVAYNNEQPLIGDHVTYMDYFNTSGIAVYGVTPTETTVANGTWSVALVTTNQDTDKKATVSVTYASNGVESDTWNDTAFDIDTDDHIVAVSIRIGAASHTGAVHYKFGLATKTDFFTGIIYFSDTQDTMIYLTQSFYDWIDEYATPVADDALYFYFWEDNANGFVNGETITVSIKFYSSVSTEDFNTYMLYTGVVMLSMGLAMTKYWNPTGRHHYYGRRPRGYMPNRRFRRPRFHYRRPRFHYRRPRFRSYRRPQFRRRRFNRRRRY